MKKYLDWIKKNVFNEKEDDNKSKEKYKEVTEKDTTYANNTENDKIYISHMDELFWEAGCFIIEKNMASIGFLQREFRIGFNRALRIMEELYEAGIVGEESGTEPRKILISLEEMEELRYKDRIRVGEKVKSEPKEESTYITLGDVEKMTSEEIGIDVDYSNDGENLGKLKNYVVPSISDENQIEVINTLLKFNSPLTMRLVLMDDSIINYSIYSGVLHLFIPIVTDEKKMDAAIQWCLTEMENRMKLFSEHKVRNIDSFNHKMDNAGEEKCPRLIFVVNEASVFLKYVSISLERLFLNSNRVGIYFILFSRFSLKALSLRGMKEVLQSITAEQLCALLSQSENLRNSKIETTNFDNMDGYQFERFCAKILCENGFENVEVTQGSGDHGIDILAERDDITYAIQCKCYSSDIGNAAIQQAYTGKGFYNKDIAVVLTNRYFTPQAVEEARTLGVKLWDRNKLIEMVGGQKYLDSENTYNISNRSCKENEVLRQYNENRGEGELRILSIEEKIAAIEDGGISRYLYQYLEEASRIAIDMYLENGDGNSYTEDMIRCVERPIEFFNAKFNTVLGIIKFVYYCGMKTDFKSTGAFEKLSNISKENSREYADDLLKIDVLYDIKDIFLNKEEISIGKMPEIDISTDDMETIEMLESIDEYDLQIGDKYFVTENFFPMKLDNIKFE